MIDNVATGPVTLQPGNRKKIDDRAWEALEQLCADPGSFMLMHYEPSGRFGKLVAGFKHRDTRLYHRVAFSFVMADPSTRLPSWEPLLDWRAQHSLLVDCESSGVRSEGLRRGLQRIRDRVQHLTGRLLPEPSDPPTVTRPTTESGVSA